MTGDENEAVLIGTWLTDGQSIAICQDCLVPFLVAQIGAITGKDADPIIAYLFADPIDTRSDEERAADSGEMGNDDDDDDDDDTSTDVGHTSSKSSGQHMDTADDETHADDEVAATSKDQ